MSSVLGGKWELSYFRLGSTAIRFYKSTETSDPACLQGEVDLVKAARTRTPVTCTFVG